MNQFLVMALAAGAAMGSTWLLGYVFIPWLHKLRFGQVILDIGPSWHKHKQGTPTMGGFMFIIGILASAAAAWAADYATGGRLLASPWPDYIQQQTAVKLLAGLIMAVLFALMGFADDYVKVVKKRNMGLTVVQKTVAQVLISAGYLTSLWLSMGKRPFTLIPFLGEKALFPGTLLFFVFGYVVIYATVNSANFTDGVDGLCSGVTITAAAGFLVFAVLRGMFGIGVVAAATVGGLAGFLIWNHNPAKVIMGDTGSNFLGGVMLAIAFALDTPVILLLMCLIYVIEGMSDVLQIGWYKLSGGKRIFKMAPIHHHFEMSGWKEKKIGWVFSLVNLAGVIAALVVVWFGLQEHLRP
ncbi:MAG: phospho-N-acetylmuramoyl-pentapeptide-transferase [Oscillospiraceae bacterium]|nr:phospho-N-acetylmuramoyl-pentapeptide-transferase [Oscillospiraceae bacterium]